MKRSAEDLLQAFTQMTNMSVSLYDKGFHGIVGFSGGARAVHICSMIHRCDSCLGRCIESDRNAKSVCPDTGEAFAYLCPFGMCEIIVAIRQSGSTIGYLLAGKSLPVGAEAEERMCTALQPYWKEIGDASLIREKMRSLPRHTPEEYDAICRLLEALAEVIGADDLFLGQDVQLAVLVYRYLKKNYYMHITLPELSMLFHCNTVTLSEKFRKEYGKTIIEALTAIRLEHAKKLLRQTELSIEEIAERCGFSERRYFTKCFHRSEGYSPSLWRQYNQHNDDKKS